MSAMPGNGIAFTQPSQPTERDLLSSLPHEVLCMIAAYLPASSLLSLALVNKSSYFAAKHQLGKADMLETLEKVWGPAEYWVDGR